MVTTTDIKNRLGAGRYYQLLSESALDEWDNNETYAIGARITQYLDKINYSASYISLTDSNLDNDPATDSVNWALDSLPAQQCLNSASLFVEAFVIGKRIAFDEDNKFQKEAIILYCIGEIVDYGNPAQEDEPKKGESDRDQAKTLLENVYSFKAEDEPSQAPYLFVSKSNRETYNTLEDNDPNSQFRQDYTSRDIGAESDQ